MVLALLSRLYFQNPVKTKTANIYKKQKEDLGCDSLVEKILPFRGEAEFDPQQYHHLLE